MWKSYSRTKRANKNTEVGKLNVETLKKACQEYKRIEGRASFYDVAIEIVDEFPLQASIIILAVWNTGRFRFMASDSQNLIDLKNAIVGSAPLFESVKEKDFRTVKFDEIKDTVKRIYSMLSKVLGVEYTGASKVMHLLNRNLFVMWDKDTREEYGYYIADENDYFDFQKKMQEKFGGIEWRMASKTLTKAIDEYNQVNIAIPKKEQRKKQRKARKEQRKLR